MGKNQILELLMSNGLSQRESKVYYAALSNPNSTPNKLHIIAGVSQSKIYEILALLVSKELISEELIGRKKVYRAINPDDYFKSVIEIEEAKLLDLKAKNQELRAEVADIYIQSDKNSSPYTGLEHLSDPVMIENRIKFHFGNSKKEIMIFSKPPYFGKSGDYDDVIGDDVKVRTIMENNPKNPDLEKINALIYDKRETIRLIDELPLKIVIIDNKVSVLALTANNSNGSDINTIIIDEPAIAGFMKELFEIKWKQAVPVEDIQSKLKE